MAINDSLRFGRTRIREDIAKEYNVKLGRLYASDRKKGLHVKPAYYNNLQGTITAGNMPVGLSGFNGNRLAVETTGYNISFASSIKTRKMRVQRKAIRKAGGISVEIKKGRRDVIRSAFKIPKYGSLVFARGNYSAFGFLWRHRRVNTTGQDKPIEVLNSTSVATMALNKHTVLRYFLPIHRKYEQELQRQLKRLL